MTETGPSLPIVKKGYVDTPDGQVHYRTAGKAIENKVPLFCFHQSPNSSLTFHEILPYLGSERLAYALDTPGFGESFRPEKRPQIPDYARWLRGTANALGYKKFDICGIFTGAGIASHMAMAYPEEVRRVVLIGPPLFNEKFHNKLPWPELPKLDGSHLMIEWNKMMETLPISGINFERQFETYRELWRGGAHAIWGEDAVNAYSLKDTLPQITRPVLVVYPDGIRADVTTAIKLLKNPKVARLEEIQGYFMMQTHPKLVASAINPFLDAA